MAKAESITSPGLEVVIQAFEDDHARSGHALLGDYVPNRQHPDYLAIVSELIRADLEFSRQRGHVKSLDEYQDEYRYVFEDPVSRQNLAFEDYRLRCQAGEVPSPADYARQYRVLTDDWPSPQSPAEQFKGAQDDLENRSWFKELFRSESSTRDASPDDFPQTGIRFLQFELVSELGRGAFGRVYLARQADLANRYVALKVTSEATLEHDRLARLQHTNIVPIHSVHQVGSLQAICMPYFGATTLADILELLRKRNGLPTSGKELLSTVSASRRSTLRLTGDEFDSAQAPPISIPQEIPLLPEFPPANATLEHLQSLTYVEVVLWMASQLAAGLEHAHQRGLTHQDLKPANVLLTDDGLPMLLDFNLATEIAPSGSSAVLVGGTLPYMAPEHIAALRAGGTVGKASDIYSLGVILFEVLTGKNPFPLHRGSFDQVTTSMLADRRDGAPRASDANSAISPAVDSIVAKCLVPDLQNRYASAHELQTDLECQLKHLPLKYAANTSLKERGRKWGKRHPRLASTGSLAIVASIVFSAIAVFWMIRERQMASMQAAATFHRFQEQFRFARIRLSAADIEESSVSEGIQTARRAIASYGLETSPDWSEDPTFHRLPLEQQAIAREELGELAYLMSGIAARRAAKTISSDKRQQQLAEALQLNELSSTAFASMTPSRAIILQRGEILDIAGQRDEAERARRDAEQTPVKTRTDRFLIATNDVIHRNYRRALSKLLDLSHESPDDFAVQFMLGNCYTGIQSHSQAENCFSTCVALWPDSFLSRFYRGLSRLQLRRYGPAAQDFSDVLGDRPNFIPALVNRALAHQGQSNFQLAITDLTTALDRGAKETRIYFLRARMFDRLGETEKAKNDRRRGMQMQPVDAESWVARGNARLPGDPETALSEYRRALEIRPNAHNALQNIAHVHSEYLDKTDEAIRTLSILLKHYPEDSAAWAGRGVLHARLDHRKKAMSDAQSALQRTRDAQTVYRVACIHALMSNETNSDSHAALGFLAESFRKEPGLADVARTDADLQSLRPLKQYHLLLAAADLLRPSTQQ